MTYIDIGLCVFRMSKCGFVFSCVKMWLAFCLRGVPLVALRLLCCFGARCQGRRLPEGERGLARVFVGGSKRVFVGGSKRLWARATARMPSDDMAKLSVRRPVLELYVF